jgi:hypothetical protein
MKRTRKKQCRCAEFTALLDAMRANPWSQMTEWGLTLPSGEIIKLKVYNPFYSVKEMRAYFDRIYGRGSLKWRGK